MLSLIPKREINVAGIKLLRTFTELGISEIRRCAESGESVRDIKIFGSDWQDERLLIARLGDLLADAEEIPLTILDHDEYGNRETLTSVRLDERIEHWYGIEQDTERQTELELGEISDPDEFETADDDWAAKSLQRVRLRRTTRP